MTAKLYRKELNLLDKFFENPSNENIMVLDDCTYCKSCDMDKHLDMDNCQYVCVGCGGISNNDYAKLFNDYLPAPTKGLNLSYTHSYKRSYRFEKILDKELCLYPKLESNLNLMFRQLVPIFKKICLNSRKNFIRYHYIIYKLLEILGKDQLLIHFNLPKSKLITYHYDRIWENMCYELGWEYIPTVCLLCIIEDR